jgi:hypothetical protein
VYLPPPGPSAVRIAPYSPRSTFIWWSCTKTSWAYILDVLPNRHETLGASVSSICKFQMTAPEYPLRSSPSWPHSSFSLAPSALIHLPQTQATLCLSRWLEAKASRPDATCASPSKFRGQHIRDTDAFRSCKFPTKRSKKASRH